MRFLIIALAGTCLAAAQQPSPPQDATLEALLKEVRALRLALEQNAQTGPRIQILLAAAQAGEQRVRTAAQQVQTVRDTLADRLARAREIGDRIKAVETEQSQINDPTIRRQSESTVGEMKLEVERITLDEQRLRAKEAEATLALKIEQEKWDETNQRLASIERALSPPPQ